MPRKRIILAVQHTGPICSVVHFPSSPKRRIIIGTFQSKAQSWTATVGIERLDFLLANSAESAWVMLSQTIGSYLLVLDIEPSEQEHAPGGFTLVRYDRIRDLTKKILSGTKFHIPCYRWKQKVQQIQ